MKYKKSLFINVILLLLVAAAFLFPPQVLWHKLLLSMGLFGLSGSLTNSLAIQMLFERIPLVYGSGIIVLNFEEIKRDLEQMIMRQFFQQEQIERFLAAEVRSLPLDLGQMEQAIDFGALFVRFKSGLAESFKGNPLLLMALPLLENNRDKLILAIKESLRTELQDVEFQRRVKEVLFSQLQAHEQHHFEASVRQLVAQRLAEMTPQMVKELIKHMMESKLVWLVVWGAVIGALMGLGAALLRYFVGI